MLGRQQIANIPTALHELFKNAHDAYADNVVADFFRGDRILVIRDDGDGMTREQLRAGWLTLASPAKLDANNRPPSLDDSPRPRRTIMGEKGIGRLAIASIGPQVLIMTRAKSVDGTAAPLHLSLVHWGVNQLADVELSRIVIPTARFDGEGLPGGDLVEALSERLISNVSGLRSASNSDAVDRILADIRSFDVDPALDIAGLGTPSLADGGNGTHFVIRPTEDVLVYDLEPPNPDEVSPMQKYLLGFSNTMMPDRPPPSIVAVLNDHKEDGTVSTPIGVQEFFTPDEFRDADHAIEGEFDGFGHFRGRISVYRQDPREHEIVWRAATGSPTRCGPFRITFAYLQGLAGESRLPLEEWTKMSTKLNRIGGMYVYRDGIRILPYGGPDQDFVGIERRRTKSASDWFFSYRRIFGAVEITNEFNPRLKEKAGREGFIRDGAYNDFVGILASFFETLAIDFFRESSRHGEWFETKERLAKEAKLLAARAKSARGKAAQFARALSVFFDNLEAGKTVRDAQVLEENISGRLSALPRDPDVAGPAILEIERDLHRGVSALEASIALAKPRGMGLSRARAADWEAYGRNVQKLRTEVLGPLRRRTAAMVEDAIASRGVEFNRRQRAATVLRDKAGRAVHDAGRLRRKVETSLEDLRTGVSTVLRETISSLEKVVESSVGEVLRDDNGTAETVKVDVLQARLEATIDSSSAQVRDMLEALADQFRTLLEAIRRGETLDETTDALETQSIAYREQLDQYVELAQLGSAVGIVQHEFSSAVTTVRTSISKLGGWASANPALGELERDLRIGFEHLDTYLQNFAPLSRRLSRAQTTISGHEIRIYLDEVFGDRMQRHGVVLDVSLDFDGHSLKGQPSAILAAFVNIVDNALHWLVTVPVDSRTVYLGVDGDGMTVANSGPGIEARIAERIFEFGVTTRVGGRGMGLYVSRAALERSGLALSLVTVGGRSHPKFKIAPADGNLTEEVE